MGVGCREVKEVINLVKQLENTLQVVFVDGYAHAKAEFTEGWDQLKASFAQLPDLWETLTKPSQLDLAEYIESNPVFDLADKIQALTTQDSANSTLFGGVNLISQADANLQSRIGDKSQEIFNNAFAGCDSNSSIAGTIAGVTAGATQTVASAGTAIQATFFALSDLDNQFTSAIFTDAALNFIKRQTSEKFILKQIRDTIKEINEDIEKLTEDDYSVDHKLAISEAYQKLLQSDEFIRTQISNINRKFPVSRPALSQARENIDQVRDFFTGIDIQDLFGGLLSLRAIRIAGRLAYLEILDGYLNQEELVSERIRLNLKDFDKAFSDLTNFDDLLLPGLTLARCRLGTVMGQMGVATAKNNLATYALTEKKWALDLAVTSSILRTTEKLGKITSNDPLNVSGLVEPLGGILGQVQDSPGIIAPGQVSDTVRLYIDNVKYKLSYNAPVEQIQARGELAIRLIKRKLEQNESLILGIGTNAATIQQSGGLAAGFAALAAIKGAIGTIKSFATALDNLSAGGIKDFYDGSFVDQLVEGIFGQILTLLEAELAKYGCTLDDLGRGVLNAYGVFEDTLRSDALFNESLDGYPETRLRQLVTDDLPKYEVSDSVSEVKPDSPTMTGIDALPTDSLDAQTGPAPAQLE
jgi:hypothetical protein